jgi:hypothetical protein
MFGFLVYGLLKVVTNSTRVIQWGPLTGLRVQYEFINLFFSFSDYPNHIPSHKAYGAPSYSRLSEPIQILTYYLAHRSYIFMGCKHGPYMNE